MYEHSRQRLLSRGEFFWRFVGHAAVALVIVIGSLYGGMLGYESFEHLNWLDAFLNASMLLGGMGPVDLPVTPGGKLFAGFYALYAGMVFLVIAGLVLAPIAHRVLHRFHLEGEPSDEAPDVEGPRSRQRRRS